MCLEHVNGDDLTEPISFCRPALGRLGQTWLYSRVLIQHLHLSRSGFWTKCTINRRLCTELITGNTPARLTALQVPQGVELAAFACDSRRANPRIETTTEVGRPRGACGTNSRWNRIAIRADDMTQNISFSVVSTVGGTNVTAMFIDGVLRSEVNLNDMRPFGLGAPVSRPQPGDNCGWCQRGGLTMDTTYVICRVQEWPMGLVAIGTECTEGIFPGATNR
eukprot:SAG31_NODE_614_length_13525_cov_4.312230_8_plen_221_part_00